MKLSNIFYFISLLFVGMNCTAQNIDKEAALILQQLTLKQKVFEMHGHNIIPFGWSQIASKKVKPIKAGGNKKREIPSAIFYDGPRGIFHYKGATAFPTTMARSASWDIDLEKKVGEAMAKEVRALGGNYTGAVCMNLLRHPAWGRAQETYGEDPHQVGEMAAALVAGIQQHKVQACAKHFAANSMENNRFGGSMNMDERTLHDVYLPHFKKVVDRGVASIMSAYNKLNGEYSGHNKILLTDILRTQWGFKGYVTSDWSYGLFDAQKGIEAGMNVEMPIGKIYKLSTIKKLLKKEKITTQQIDELIFPTIRTKLLFDIKQDTQTYPKTLVGCEAHTNLAREVAEKSAVLLKNENRLLPLDKNSVKKIAVIGSLATIEQTGDRGSSRVTPSYIISPFEGIQRYFDGTNTAVVTAPNSDFETIKTICKNADVVIVVAGTTYLDEGEYIGNFKIRDSLHPDKKNFVVKMGILGLGGDRAYLHLHPSDIEVIKIAASVNPNIVVNLVAGSAVTVEEWHDQVAAILHLGYNGQEGGNALAQLLFGEVNPSGKLPFTAPKLVSDLPPFNSFADTVHYGYYHGYTLFDKTQTTPRYPFGFGLSYTNFQLTDLKLEVNETLTLTVKVKNIGMREGAEVVQAYIGTAQYKTLDLPQKLLRGFTKVSLQAGEEKEVSITISLAELAHYDSEQKKSIIEKGKYNLWLGNCSAGENLLMDSFEVE